MNDSDDFENEWVCSFHGVAYNIGVYLSCRFFFMGLCEYGKPFSGGKGGISIWGSREF